MPGDIHGLSRSREGVDPEVGRRDLVDVQLRDSSGPRVERREDLARIGLDVLAVRNHGLGSGDRFEAGLVDVESAVVAELDLEALSRRAARTERSGTPGSIDLHKAIARDDALSNAARSEVESEARLALVPGEAVAGKDEAAVVHIANDVERVVGIRGIHAVTFEAVSDHDELAVELVARSDRFGEDAVLASAFDLAADEPLTNLAKVDVIAIVVVEVARRELRASSSHESAVLDVVEEDAVGRVEIGYARIVAVHPVLAVPTGLDSREDRVVGIPVDRGPVHAVASALDVDPGTAVVIGEESLEFATSRPGVDPVDSGRAVASADSSDSEVSEEGAEQGSTVAVLIHELDYAGLKADDAGIGEAGASRDNRSGRRRDVVPTVALDTDRVRIHKDRLVSQVVTGREMERSAFVSGKTLERFVNRWPVVGYSVSGSSGVTGV